MDGNIEITKSNAYFFLDSIAGDMIFYTSSNSQSILFGTLSNANSGLKINSDLMQFNQRVSYNYNTGFYENFPKASIHTTRDFLISSNPLSQQFTPSEHSPSIYMRYAAESNGSYIQSIERNSILSTYHNLNIEGKTISLNSSNIISLYGNVGINTSSPSEALHIAGNLRLDANLILNSNAYFVFGTNPGLAGRIGNSLLTQDSLDIIGLATSNQKGRTITFYIDSNIGNASAGSATFYGGNLLLTTGNIGIGASASNPQAQIHIGQTKSNNILIKSDNLGHSSLEFNGNQIDSTKSTWRIYTDQSSSNDSFNIQTLINSNIYNYFTFYDFNIGYNMTTPTAKIHIVGNTTLGAAADGTQTKYNPLTLEDNSGNLMRIVHKNTHSTNSTMYNYETNKNVYWGESDDIGAYLFQGRNVSIGTAYPDIKLSIGNGPQDVTSALKFNTGYGDKIYFTTSNTGSRISLSSNNTSQESLNLYTNSLTFATRSNIASSNYTEQMRIDTYGNLGIHTSNPQAILHIVTNTSANPSNNPIAIFDGLASQPSQDNIIKILGRSNQYMHIDLLDQSTNGWRIGQCNQQFSIQHTNGQTAIQLTSNGNIYMSSNIGIGVNLPESQLHVSSTLQIGTQSTTTLPSQSILSLRGNNQTAYRQWNFMVGASNNNSTAYDTMRLRLYDSNQERLTINDSGFIGMGISTPSNILHVSAPSNSLAIFETTDSNASSYITFRASNSGQCFIGTDGTGLANNSPGSLILGTQNNYNILLSTSNKERMRVTSNGNISISNNLGLGITNPTEKLHVEGSILSSQTGAAFAQFTKISGPLVEVQASNALYQCYIEPGYTGIHLESIKQDTQTPLPMNINTLKQGPLIIGGNLYPNSNTSSLGVINNQWSNMYASNANITNLTTSNIIVTGSLNTNSTNNSGVRLNFKANINQEKWFIRGPDITSNSLMMLGYNNTISDCNILRVDSGLYTASRGITCYGGITATEDSTFQSKLTASSLIGQTYYSVTANLSSNVGDNFNFTTMTGSNITYSNIFTFMPVENLTYNISTSSFKSFTPPVTGLWRVDAIFAWPMSYGSYYGISLVKNYTSISGSSTPGGTIIDWYKLGANGTINTRPTTVCGSEYRFNLSGVVYLTTSDNITTVIGNTYPSISGSNISNFNDCKITISLIQRTA